MREEIGMSVSTVTTTSAVAAAAAAAVATASVMLVTIAIVQLHWMPSDAVASSRQLSIAISTTFVIVRVR